jgi:heme-degrading monooxygenase HmoA
MHTDDSRTARKEIAMIARFLRFSVREGALTPFVDLYGSRIVQVLSGIDGCLGAAVLHSVRHERQLISITFWAGSGEAAAYDQEGRFGRLLNEADAYMAGSDDEPDAEDLQVEGYSAELLIPADLSSALVVGRYARTAEARVEAEHLDEFDRRYRAETGISQNSFPGLRAVLLLHGSAQRERTIGLSVWENEEAAARYELSGRFEELEARLAETLSPVYRWRASLVSGDAGGSARGFRVEGFRILLARIF